MTHQCAYCGRPFDRQRHGQRVHRFCSRKCAAQTSKANHPNARKTRCKNGHEFTPANTGHRLNGARWCRACHSGVTRNARAARPEEESVRRHQRYLRGDDAARLAARKSSNDQSRNTAQNHCKQWTGPQLEIATRANLSDREVAKLTGRTIRAVETIRRRLKDDPRLYQMAT